MKRRFVCVATLMLPLSVVAQQESADSSNVLNDVVIHEKFEAQHEEEKLPFDMELDFSEVVNIDLSLGWDSIDAIQNPDGSHLNNELPLQLSSPELAVIQPAPVKVFHTQFEQVSRWQLNITASNGGLFRTIAGEGNPPAEIAWDGKSNSGDPLIAGENYAYNFTAVDKAGNKKTFPGSSFSVPAFYILLDGGLLIGLDSSRLFTTDRIRLLPQAKRYAREIAGLIRYYSRDEGVTINSNIPDWDSFLEILSDELMVNDDFFTRMHHGVQHDNSLKIYIK